MTVLKEEQHRSKQKLGYSTVYLKTQVCVSVYFFTSSLMSLKNIEGNVIKLCEKRRRLQDESQKLQFLLFCKSKSSVQVCFSLNVL